MIKLKDLLIETIDKTNGKIGYDVNNHFSEMPINWNARDIQILDKWDINTVRKFFNKPDTFVSIYRTILDVSDLDAQFSEEELEFGEFGYEWNEFRMKKGGFPPILVRRNKHGHILMSDGNHRVKWAEEMGYKTIGAWVLDEFLQLEIDKQK